jgi:membrane complex biogenesis BtpA family protein
MLQFEEPPASIRGGGSAERFDKSRTRRPPAAALLDPLPNMKSLFTLAPKLLIGVVHLRALPGAPLFRGDLVDIIKAAVTDAIAYERGGAHAIIVENFGDVPFPKSSVAPETLTAMTAAGCALRAAVKLPMGFNVLRNDAPAALALCAAAGGSFIRVNVLSGAMLTDQGLIEGDAYHTLRYRERICPGAEILADVHVKHAVPLGEWSLEDAARDTLERGLAAALIVSGVGTGHAADLGDVERVRRACPQAKILLGSGVTAANVKEFLHFADGVIVGTSLKKGGKLTSAVDSHRVATLLRAMK